MVVGSHLQRRSHLQVGPTLLTRWEQKRERGVKQRPTPLCTTLLQRTNIPPLMNEPHQISTASQLLHDDEPPCFYILFVYNTMRDEVYSRVAMGIPHQAIGDNTQHHQFYQLDDGQRDK